MGRPLELTDDIAETICSQVEKGTPVTLAAQMAGFTARALFKWQAQGNADIEAGNGGAVNKRGELVGGTPHARLVHRLARARGQMAAPLVQAAMGGAAKGDDVRGVLSTLKTFLPAHFGDRALEVTVALEQAADAPEQAGAGPADAAVRVELVRCGACGEDQLPGKRLCGDCGVEMPRPGA